jgi:hypothetical protein
MRPSFDRSISTTNLQSRIKIQLNTMLFAKTLVRKDVAGGAPPAASIEAGAKEVEKKENDEEDEEDVTSKSQVVSRLWRFSSDASPRSLP